MVFSSADYEFFNVYLALEIKEVSCAAVSIIEPSMSLADQPRSFLAFVDGVRSAIQIATAF